MRPNNLPDVLFGFLGGMIISAKNGYKVLPQTPSERTFQRLADAKWFLALLWCEQFSTPAGILTNTEEFSFQNEPALRFRRDGFIPSAYRAQIFNRCLRLNPGESEQFMVPVENGNYNRTIEIQGVEIDPRYGKVALLRESSIDGSISTFLD